jgi:hypothetical protein
MRKDFSPMKELKSIIFHTMHEISSRAKASAKLKHSRQVTRTTKSSDFGVVGTRTL